MEYVFSQSCHASCQPSLGQVHPPTLSITDIQELGDGFLFLPLQCPPTGHAIAKMYTFYFYYTFPLTSFSDFVHHPLSSGSPDRLILLRLVK